MHTLEAHTHASVHTTQPNPTQPPIYIYVYFATKKMQKVRYITQKCSHQHDDFLLVIPQSRFLKGERRNKNKWPIAVKWRLYGLSSVRPSFLTTVLFNQWQLKCHQPSECCKILFEHSVTFALDVGKQTVMIFLVSIGEQAKHMVFSVGF